MTAGTDPWNPERYERFHDERTRPFRDLVALVERRRIARALDLGCGTGETTLELHESLGCEMTLGIDRSARMLDGAQHRAPGLSFARADVAALPVSVRFDLVFSNAALHWLDDHGSLLSELAERVAPGGQLAVQVPANHDHPSHLVAAEVAGEEPFRTALDGYVRRSPVLAPEAYALLLYRLGLVDREVRLAVYSHELDSREDVVEWVRGTTLTDYAKRMPDELFEQFLERYRERLLPRLDAARPHLFPFKRILLRAARPGPTSTR